MTQTYKHLVHLMMRMILSISTYPTRAINLFFHSRVTHFSYRMTTTQKLQLDHIYFWHIISTQNVYSTFEYATYILCLVESTKYIFCQLHFCF